MVPTAAISAYYYNLQPWPKTGATHYHAQLELPGKGREIKGLVVKGRVAIHHAQQISKIWSRD